MIVEKAGEAQLLIRLKIRIGKKISQYKLDPTLNWKFAEIISIDDSKIRFEIIDKKKKVKRELF